MLVAGGTFPPLTPPSPPAAPSLPPAPGAAPDRADFFVAGPAALPAPVPPPVPAVGPSLPPAPPGALVPGAPSPAPLAGPAGGPRQAGLAGRFGSQSASGMMGEIRPIAHLVNVLRTGLEADKGRSLNGAFQGALPLMQRSAVFEAVLSGIDNGLQLIEGRIGPGELVVRVSKDTLNGLVGGAGAAMVASGLLALFPVSGVMATVVGALGGLLGYDWGLRLFSHTGIPQAVDRLLRRVFTR
ncbi:MAG: hypothetical protein VKP62_14455 [Candidatus Sericytochromatia bacterium]|nr:hypothetical protein [Candidatus Sericytochromatia bacterium]